MNDTEMRERIALLIGRLMVWLGRRDVWKVVGEADEKTYHVEFDANETVVMVGERKFKITVTEEV